MSGKEGHAPAPVGIPKFESKTEMYKKCFEECEIMMRDIPKLSSLASASSSSTTISLASPSIATNLTEMGSKQSHPMNEYRLFARLITSLSNISSILFYNMNAYQATSSDNAHAQALPLHSLPINWVGWYLLDRSDRLALSSFQGKLACQHIKLGKGMCGMAMLTNKDLAIEDVQADPRHIACDAASQSEVIICLRDGNGRAVGVLDIDSAIKNRFSSQEDIEPLRAICGLVAKYHSEELTAVFKGATMKEQHHNVINTSSSAATSSGSHVGISKTDTTIHHHQNYQQKPPQQTCSSPSGCCPTTTTNDNNNQQQNSRTLAPNMSNVQRRQQQQSTTTAIPSSSQQQQQQQQQQPAVEHSDLQVHKNWELSTRCKNEMLASAAIGELEERLGVKQLPEIIFDLNEIHFVMDEKSGNNQHNNNPLKFRVCAQASLQNVVNYASSEEFKTQHKNSLFPKVKSNAHWEAKRSEFATFDPNIDWAFRSNYIGVWSDSTGSLCQIQEADPEKFEDEKIDYETLRRTDLPILFFASIDLWEDDLHDNGVSKMVAKARVMDPCFFVLVRHILRVDGVRLQVRDARHFHHFGTKKIIIEESQKAVDIPKFLEENPHLSSEDFHRTLMTSQVEQLDMLKEEWKKVSVVKLPTA